MQTACAYTLKMLFNITDVMYSVNKLRDPKSSMLFIARTLLTRLTALGYSYNEDSLERTPIVDTLHSYILRIEKIPE